MYTGACTVLCSVLTLCCCAWLCLERMDVLEEFDFLARLFSLPFSRHSRTTVLAERTLGLVETISGTGSAEILSICTAHDVVAHPRFCIIAVPKRTPSVGICFHLATLI